MTTEDRERWRDIATRMFVPIRDGLLLQFEGYDDLSELDWEDYRPRYGDISRLDRILEAEGRSVNAYKVSKQADVLMLFYLFTADEVTELLDGLGYQLDRASIPAMVDYYLGRTCHGSTLSTVAHTWVLARAHRDQAWEFLTEVAASDIKDTHGGTTAEGVHLAAHGRWRRPAAALLRGYRAPAGQPPRVTLLAHRAGSHHLHGALPGQRPPAHRVPDLCARRRGAGRGQPGACHLRRDDVPAGSGAAAGDPAGRVTPPGAA